MSILEDIKPCPFCGGKVRLLVSDDEGNIRNEEYENDPWSGLSYKLHHTYEENEGCPIATYNEDDMTLGVYLYDSKEEAIKAWNNRI